MDTVLETRGLTKRYGRILAVNNLNLIVPKGTVYGILGPNGSGKTTTLGMALSVTRPTAGDCLWFGEPVAPSTLKRIGAILEGPLFYPYLTGERNLEVVAKIKGVDAKRIDRVLDIVGLQERRASAFKTYSLGMKQRLAIAAALLADPEVLILDEPTNGLDPQGIAEIRDLIRVIAQDGTTILLASHLLDEVEKVCSHVAVLKKGNLIYSGRVEDMGGTRDTVELATEDLAILGQYLKNWTEVEKVEHHGDLLVVTFQGDPDPVAINQRLFGDGITLSHLAVRKSRLEDQFLQLVSQNENPA